MARRGRGGARRDGFDSYNYTFDYDNDPAGSYSFVSESWMTSFPMPSNQGAKHLGPARDSYGSYSRMDRNRYGFLEPARGYGSQRAQHLPYPSQIGWRGNERGGLGGNFRSPPAIGGPGRPTPLLNQRTFQDATGSQGLKAFTGNSYFGGGFKQKSRKLWKDKKPAAGGGGGGGPAEKKIKTSQENEEAKSEESGSEGDGEHEGAGTKTTEADDKQEEAEETDKKQKPVLTKQQLEMQNRRQRDRMVERIQFVCSLCKFRTFYNEEMTSHLESEFHKEHFRYVGGKLPKQSADFLQEYVMQKAKKTEERRDAIEDLSTTIQQIYRDQDLTQELGMEHFVKKVEAAHCAACEVFIPMNFSAIQRHIRTQTHNQNRRNTMENSKKTGLAVARSILNNKLISEKLERYIKGQNPFIEEQDEAAGSVSAALETSEGQQMEENDSLQSADLAACCSSMTSAPDTTSADDASDERMIEGGEMCASDLQE